MANQGGSNGGNGHSGGDAMAMLHSAVMHLQGSLARHQSETLDGFTRVQETLDRFRETLSRHHRETMDDIGRIAEILMAVGDKLKDHERRLALVEAKLS